MLSSRGCQDDQNAKREGLELAKVYLKTPSKNPTVTQLRGDRTQPHVWSGASGSNSRPTMMCHVM
jgi:hypothetical protein